MTDANRTGRFNSNGVDIFYRRFGAARGVPLLIAHGASYFSYDWIPVAEALADERCVVAMDMRGFGDSGWSPEHDYSIPTMASDIENLLDHLGWKRAALMGHSLGGRSTAYCATRNPGRIAGLALIEHSPQIAPEGAKRVMLTVAGQPDFFASVDDAMRYYGIDPGSAKGQSKRARYEAYLRPVPGGFQFKRDPHFRDEARKTRDTGERPKLGVDLWDVLRQVSCPLLVMRGTRSDMFTADTALKMKETNPALELVEIDAGHDIAADDPDAFLRSMRRFLGSLQA